MQVDDRERSSPSSTSAAAGGTFGTDALTSEDGDCILEHVRENLTDEQIERAILEHDLGYAFDAMRDCMGGGDDLIAMTQLIKNQLSAEEGVSKRQANCLAGIAIAGIRDATPEQLAQNPRVKARVEKALKDGAFICAVA